MKAKLIILAVSATISLSGCLPTIFVAGAAAGGSVIYDHRDTGTMVKDRDTTFKIQNQLDLNQDLFKKAHVSIIVFNRIGLLVGQASTPELRQKAEDITKSYSQLRKLYNEIIIAPPINPAQITNDAWTTTKVKTVLLATPGLSSTDLKVITEEGTIYLMGLTTPKQAELATEKTKTVAGVNKIVKLFEYLD